MVTKKTKGLGKGLGMMFGVKNVAEALSPVQLEGQTPKVDVSKLVPGKYQARKVMHQESIQELADSIRENGILNPIVVRRQDDNYEILAGERRYRAALEAGLLEVPVTILNVNDEVALSIGLIENLQREDLNVMEAAAGLHRLIEEFEYTHDEVARAVGRSRSAVTNLLRLLALIPEVQSLVREEKLDMGHARALVGLDEAHQAKVAHKIISQGLSVRQVESLVEGLKQGVEVSAKTTKVKDQELVHLEKDFGKRFGAKVILTQKSNGAGKIQLSFTDPQAYESFLRKLSALRSE